MRADVVKDYFMFGNLHAQDNAVGPVGCTETFMHPFARGSVACGEAAATNIASQFESGSMARLREKKAKN